MTSGQPDSDQVNARARRFLKSIHRPFRKTKASPDSSRTRSAPVVTPRVQLITIGTLSGVVYWINSSTIATPKLCLRTSDVYSSQCRIDLHADAFGHAFAVASCERRGRRRRRSGLHLPELDRSRDPVFRAHPAGSCQRTLLVQAQHLRASH